MVWLFAKNCAIGLLYVTHIHISRKRIAEFLAKDPPPAPARWILMRYGSFDKNSAIGLLYVTHIHISCKPEFLARCND